MHNIWSNHKLVGQHPERTTYTAGSAMADGTVPLTATEPGGKVVNYPATDWDFIDRTGRLVCGWRIPDPKCPNCFPPAP